MLASIYKLQPLDVPEPLQRMDPLTRGSLFHEIQAQFFREMERRGELPVTAASIETRARRPARRHRRARPTGWHDELAPAVERVWIDEIAAIRRDLRAWLDSVARDGAEWLPKYFEFGFGEVPGERDPHSRPEPVDAARRIQAERCDRSDRGAHRQTKVLRV